MVKRAIVKLYKKHTKELNTMLNKWDPLYVVPAGTDDEYTDLLDPILSFLYKGTTKEELFTFLKKEMLGSYELRRIPTGTSEIAEKIIIWWKEVPK